LSPFSFDFRLPGEFSHRTLGVERSVSFSKQNRRRSARASSREGGWEFAPCPLRCCGRGIVRGRRAVDQRSLTESGPYARTRTRSNPGSDTTQHETEQETIVLSRLIATTKKGGPENGTSDATHHGSSQRAFAGLTFPEEPNTAHLGSRNTHHPFVFPHAERVVGN
jgi:hypothetical protein